MWCVLGEARIVSAGMSPAMFSSWLPSSMDVMASSDSGARGSDTDKTRVQGCRAETGGEFSECAARSDLVPNDGAAEAKEKTADAITANGD